MKMKTRPLSDREIMERFLEKAAREHLTLEEAGAKVKRSKGWASLVSQKKIKTLKFQTRNLILEYLGDGS